MRELDSEAVEHRSAALVVSTRGGGLLIWSSDPDRSDRLERVLAAGGAPLGLLRTVGADSGLRVESRVLCEYADDADVVRLVRSLASSSRKLFMP